MILDNFLSHSIFNLVKLEDDIKASVVVNVAVGYGLISEERSLRHTKLAS